MSLLKAESLSFSYPLKKERKAVLHDFSLEIRRGDFVSVVGPSGCGKSTLLKLLSGFLRPDRGELFLNGEPVISPCREGQMIFQEFNQLFPWMNIEHNIIFSRYRSVFPWRTLKLNDRDRKRLETILTLTGLLSYRTYLPHQLSGGLKQRTALARALFAEPEVLFLDEPFGSLDAPSRKELQLLLLRLWKEGNWTVLLVTHDISEALLLADRLLVFGNFEHRFSERANALARPRDRQSARFREKKMELYSLIDSE